MDMTILTDVGQRRTNNQDYANQYTNKAGKPMVFLLMVWEDTVPEILLVKWQSQT